MLNRVTQWAGRNAIRRVTAYEAGRQKFQKINERPVEYSFAFSWLNQIQPTTVLDVGTGKSALPALVRTCGFLVTAIDNIKDYWTKGLTNRHWLVEDQDITRPGADKQFDVVLCISVLEHITETRAAIEGMHARTRPGGYLILTTPFGHEGHPNVYTLPGSYGVNNRYPCRQHSPADLESWLSCGFELVAAEYWAAFDSPYWSVGSFIRPLRRSDAPAQLGCFVFRRPN